LLPPAVGNGKLFLAMVIVCLLGKVGAAQDLVFKVESVLELIRVFNRRTQLLTPLLEVIKAALDKLHIFLFDLMGFNHCLLHSDTFF
jgi:hypothetical protein